MEGEGSAREAAREGGVREGGEGGGGRRREGGGARAEGRGRRGEGGGPMGTSASKLESSKNESSKSIPSSIGSTLVAAGALAARYGAVMGVVARAGGAGVDGSTCCREASMACSPGGRRRGASASMSSSSLLSSDEICPCATTSRSCASGVVPCGPSMDGDMTCERCDEHEAIACKRTKMRRTPRCGEVGEWVGRTRLLRAQRQPD